MPSTFAQGIENSWEVIGAGIKDIVISTDLVKLIGCHLEIVFKQFLIYLASLESVDERSQLFVGRITNPLVWIPQELHHDHCELTLACLLVAQFRYLDESVNAGFADAPVRLLGLLLEKVEQFILKKCLSYDFGYAWEVYNGLLSHF